MQVSGQPGLHINTLSQGGRKLVGGKEGRGGKEEERERKKRENMISSRLPGFGLLETVSTAGSNRRKAETRTFIVAVCWCCCCLKMVWIVTT